jgi:hypothetical protein
MLIEYLAVVMVVVITVLAAVMLVEKAVLVCTYTYRWFNSPSYTVVQQLTERVAAANKKAAAAGEGYVAFFNYQTLLSNEHCKTTLISVDKDANIATYEVRKGDDVRVVEVHSLFRIITRDKEQCTNQKEKEGNDEE